MDWREKAEKQEAQEAISGRFITEVMGWEILFEMACTMEGVDLVNTLYILKDKDKNKYGYLSTAYASCDVCDIYIEWRSGEDVKDEIDAHINRSVTWKDSKKSLLDFLMGRVWAVESLESWYGKGEVDEFLRYAIIELL